jgi:uncharacterized protein YbjT (DUF2867 family)
MTGTILVVGGSGLLGAPTVRRLDEAGFTVRLLARDPDRYRKRFRGRFQIFGGDVTDRQALKDALEGCRFAHVSVGGAVDRVSAENVAAVGRQTGLERIGYVSGSTVFEENRWFPMVAAKLEAERALRKSGIAWTVFCPTWPFESLLRFVRAGRATVIGRHPTPYHWFAADDMARMVARAFRSEEVQGKRLFIHGPEAIAMREAMERVVGVLHPEIGRVGTMSAGFARFLGVVTRNPMLRFAGALMAYFDRVGELGDPSEANELLGAPTTTLDAWIRSRSRIRPAPATLPGGSVPRVD